MSSLSEGGRTTLRPHFETAILRKPARNGDQKPRYFFFCQIFSCFDPKSCRFRFVNGDCHTTLKRKHCSACKRILSEVNSRAFVFNQNYKFCFILQTVWPHWEVLMVGVWACWLIDMVSVASGSFPENFHTWKWLLWNVHVHFDCAGSHKTRNLA